MSKRPLWRSLAVRSIIGMIALAATLADASVFLREDVASLSRAASKIVRATVTDVRSEWNPDGTMIFSYVTLDIRRSFKGQRDAAVIVRVPGGVVGDFGIEMDGAPAFESGEDVVVFLGEWQDGEPMVVGYFQGVSRVRRDRAGNEIMHGGSAHGLSIGELARQVAAFADRGKP